jgi:predicted RecA/RadA family phage recombinase
MAIATRVSSGHHIDHTPSGAVVAGQVIVSNGICFVAEVPIAATKLGALACVGVFNLTKAASGPGPVFAVGESVYWNASTGATRTTSDTYFGVCVKAAEATDAVVETALRSLETAASTVGLEQLTDVDLTSALLNDVLVKSSGDWVNAPLEPKNVSRATSAGSAKTIPFIMHKVAAATPTTPAVAVGTTPVACKLIDWWVISRDTTASTLTLKNAGSACGALAKGTQNDTAVRGATIVAAYDEFVTGAAVTLVGDAGSLGAVDIFCLFLPLPDA